MPNPQDKWGKYAVPDSTATKWAQFEAKPQAQPAQNNGSFLAQTLGNIPESGYNFVKNAVTPFLHPIETAKSIGAMAAAGGNPATLYTDPNLQAMGKFFVDRYGGWDNLANTVKTDPVGFLSDLSTVFAGAGAVAKLGNLGKVAEAASTAAKITDPLSIPANAVRLGAKTVMPETLPARLYESALKPSTTLSDAERTRMTTTGLTEGILPTKSGLDKLNTNINSLNNQIQTQIVNAAAQGRTVNSADVVRRLDAIKQFYQQTAAPESFLKQIDDIQQQFMSAHGQQIPIDAAQKIKQNTYALLHNQYGEISTASKEAMKNIARGIKEEIAAQYPEIQQLNSRESALLNLQDAVERATARTYNREIVPTSSIYTGAATRIATESSGAGTAAFIMRSVLENPTVKSALAIALNKARRAGITGTPVPPVSTFGAATQQNQ